MARKANTIINIPKLILIMIISATNLKALKLIKTEMIYNSSIKIIILIQ